MIRNHLFSLVIFFSLLSTQAQGMHIVTSSNGTGLKLFNLIMESKHDEVENMLKDGTLIVQLTLEELCEIETIAKDEFYHIAIKQLLAKKIAAIDGCCS